MPPSTDPASTRWQLTWKTQPPPAIDLPTGITRSFISTPGGNLELLTALPGRSTSYPTSSVPPFTSRPPSNNPLHQTPAFENPILFVHGGFGSAAVYIPWLLHLVSHGYSCHALSLRGHGHSYDPGFLKMVVMTSATSLAEDVAAGVAHLEKLYCHSNDKDKHEKDGYRGEVVLCGHSSGGGLVQMVCDSELAKVKALVLLAGTPCFGAKEVYYSWWSMDKWFVPRMYIRDWMHPRSPLSSSELVKQAFFCDFFPLSSVKSFERLLSEYESLIWPLQSMFRGYIDTHRVLLNCNQQLFVLAGEKDRLMRSDLMERTAAEYTMALGELERDMGIAPGKGEGRVDFDEVDGSGHHLMNDVQWRDGVGILEDWFEVIGEVEEEGGIWERRDTDRY